MITLTIHDAVYTGRRRGLVRELIVSQVINKNHKKIDRGKKVRGKMEGTRERQKGRKIGGTAWKRMLAQPEHNVRQEAVCGGLVEASRKSGERAPIQSSSEEGGELGGGSGGERPG